MVAAPSTPIALWHGLQGASAWRVQTSAGDPPSDFVHYWLDYKSSTADSPGDRGLYTASNGQGMGVDFWASGSPDMSSQSYMLMGAGDWHGSSLGTPYVGLFPQFTDHEDAPSPPWSRRPMCQVHAVPPCPTGWRFMHDDVTPQGIGPRCFLQLPGLWGSVNASAACREAHSSAALLLVDSSTERGISMDDTHLPALVPRDTWLDLARLDEDDIRLLSSDGRPHGVANFVANGSYDSWRGGDPNGKTAGGCAAVDHSNYRWDIFQCHEQRPAVCEMAPPAPVVSHPAHTLARPARLHMATAADSGQEVCEAEPPTRDLSTLQGLCPPGFASFPELQTCLRMAPLPGASESWLAAQHTCATGGGVRVAALPTAGHIQAALSLFTALTPAQVSDQTVSAFISLGDWGVEGSFSTFDGRPVDIEALDIPLDAHDQDGINDCMLLRQVFGSYAMLKVARCSDGAPAFAVCERPMFLHEQSEYIMLPSGMDAPAADADCAALGAHVAVSGSVAERDALAAMAARFPAAAGSGVLTGLRGSSRVHSGIEATSGEAPADLYDGILTSHAAGLLLPNGALVATSSAAAHAVVCERDVRKVCPHGWTYGEHFCWQVQHVDSSDANTTRLGDALGECAALGAVLASPSNPGQLDFIARQMVPRGHTTALGHTGTNSSNTIVDAWADRHIWSPAAEGLFPGAAPPSFAAALSRPHQQPASYSLSNFTNFVQQLRTDSYMCQRPAYLSSFISCPQGWVPMVDRCILHSKQNIAWPWSGAAAPAEVEGRHVHQVGRNAK